jgi:hypothetical protein
MSKRKLHLISIAIVLILTTVTVWIIVSMVFGGPVSGDLRHSFGVVPIERPSSILSHTFSLTNESGHDLKLVNVVPSCGCTTSDWPSETISPKGVLLVPVNLKLTRSQLRSSKIRLEFDSGETVILYIDGIGRFIQPMSLSPQRPVLYHQSAMGTRGILKLEWDKEEAPKQPTITTPKGIRLEFDNWTRTKDADSKNGTPEIWTIRMKMFMESVDVEGGEIDISLEGVPTLVVPFSVEEDEPIGVRLD